MRCFGVADEAHAPRFEIGKPADIVVDRAIFRRRQRIDGEIAPLGVGLPVAAERDLGVTAVGLDILAQRGDLERRAVDYDRDGAVIDPGRHDLEAGPACAPYYLGRLGGRCDVDFNDRHVEQRIAHRAADHAGFFAVTIQNAEQLLRGSFTQPCRVDTARRHQRIWPGTKLPRSSTCAGTYSFPTGAPPSLAK